MDLEELAREIEACRDCDLYKTRNKVVPGEGKPDAEIMLIGEAPGYFEDREGRPFVGPAGKYLDELLRMVGLRREDVYIGNVIKCRPPQNRDPLPREIKACKKWLDKQIEIISPKIIITLGRYSLSYFFPNESISKLHGKARKWDDKIIFFMYHPAAALHQSFLRKIIEEDMRKFKEVVREIEREKEEPHQLRML